MLCKDLHLHLTDTPTLWVDNIGALALASNPVFHARTKHVEIDYHFIREKIAAKDISAQYINTNDQIADIFTKGLTTSKFIDLRNKLMIRPLPMSLRGAVTGNRDRDVMDTNTAAEESYTNTAVMES